MFKKIEQLPSFQQASHILCYWSLPDELNTHLFVDKWYVDKTIYLPKVVGKEVELIRYAGQNSLLEGAYGIMEPIGISLLYLTLIDLVIVPGIAFSKDGYRMGRGGGYYDRLLPLLPKAFKVGIAYSCQIVESIPVSKHDVNMNIVVG